MIRVAAIGECMIELACRDSANAMLGFGGDTLNTAVYLARCGAAAGISVDYVTALGTDPMSDTMVAAWAAEGIGVAKVERRADRLPGLYMIRTDDSGERRFYYWRQQAAVRELLLGDNGARLLAALAEYSVLYFSGITLAVLATEARERLRQMLLVARRRGTQVVLDSNFRPTLWPSAEAAQSVYNTFLQTLTIALPSFEDEAKLWGDASPETTAHRYTASGVPEVVVKCGDAGCIVLAEGTFHKVPVPARIKPVDTTAAGDAFNAGYLAARLRGYPPLRAAQMGHRLAGTVIEHMGAIIPRAATPDLWTMP